MPIEVLHAFPDNTTLSAEWNDLLACCSASHVPFLRYEYLSTWWKTLGGGEWPEGQLYTLLGRDDQGALRGVAPLFYTKNREGRTALLLVGSVEISDYLDFIVPCEYLNAFVEEVCDALSEPQAPPWQVLDLYNLPEESPTLAALQAAAERRDWQYHQSRLQPSPYIPLPADWESYLAALDKKQRHEIRRKLRRAEESGIPVRWYILGGENDPDEVTPQRLDAEIEEFIALMANDPEKNRFLTQVMRTQLRSAVHVAFRAGWLQLAFLEVGGRKAAAYLNFDYGNHIWVYNSGLNFEYAHLSPGWVLLANLIRWAIEHGRQRFDFMRGAEEYKYRFGAVNRYVVRAVIAR